MIERRRETEIRNALRKRELIPLALVLKQSAFLVLSLRARLLALSAQHARELAAIADERELQLRLDAIVRDALSEIAELPVARQRSGLDAEDRRRVGAVEASSSRYFVRFHTCTSGGCFFPSRMNS